MSEIIEKESENLEGPDLKDKEVEQKQLYAYLDRDNFTTEKFKIEVRGLPKHYGMGELKRFLNEKLELNASKVKPPRKGGRWAYICFRSEEFRNKAITVLNGIEWKRCKLTAHVKQISLLFFNLQFNLQFTIFNFESGCQSSSRSIYKEKI